MWLDFMRHLEFSNSSLEMKKKRDFLKIIFAYCAFIVAKKV